MKPYLYVSLIPESLVASHLSPDEFGAYLSLGSQKRSRGQAIFFSLSEAYAAEQLKRHGLDSSLGRTVGQPPRRSAYMAIYRVLEQTPMEAIEAMHIATDDGRVLTLRPKAYQPDLAPRFHLYQEFCPVTPRVVSTLEPQAFGRHLTDTTTPVSVPALVFAELRLEALATDPEARNVDNLPYSNIEHLRDCLRELRAKPSKPMKTVVRQIQQDVLYRTLRSGFYLAGPGGGFLQFPMPSREELESTLYPWWRSALSSFGG